MADRLAGAVVDLVYERAGGLTFERSRQTGRKAKGKRTDHEFHELHELNHN
jgi:hypothetical protein